MSDFNEQPGGVDHERDVIVGADAQQLLSNPTVQRVLKDMRTGCYALFMSVSANDPEMGRKLVYLKQMDNVIHQFEETLKALIHQGSSAQQALELLTRGMETTARVRTPSMYESQHEHARGEY